LLREFPGAPENSAPFLSFIAVTEEFKMRIFLEESYTLGVFGATGRGLTEYYNIDPTRLDMIMGRSKGRSAQSAASAPVLI
jgi:7-keto-8-aminopelargonate synthetase-like enzyme